MSLIYQPDFFLDDPEIPQFISNSPQAQRRVRRLEEMSRNQGGFCYICGAIASMLLHAWDEMGGEDFKRIDRYWMPLCDWCIHIHKISVEKDPEDPEETPTS